MTATNNVKFELTGVSANSTSNLGMDNPAPPLNERGFVEYLMKRTLYMLLQRFATMAVRNPTGLVADLTELRQSTRQQPLLDYANMWAKHLAVEMDTNGLFEQDIELMRKTCGGKNE